MVELCAGARNDIRILHQIERFSVRYFSLSQIILFIFVASAWPQHFRLCCCVGIEDPKRFDNIPHLLLCCLTIYFCEEMLIADDLSWKTNSFMGRMLERMRDLKSAAPSVRI